MYVEEAALDRTSLYQGDVIVEVQLFGALTLSSVTFTVDNQGTRNGWIVPQRPDFGAAMVLSHSCEIDRANVVKVTSIILAPLRDINKVTRPEKVAELIASNAIDENTAYSYLKYFYVPGLDLIGFPDGAVVDFSKCFSIRNKSYELLLEKKKAQLKDESAASMARKLALYFYRSNKAA